MSSDVILNITKLTKRFKGVTAVGGIDASFEKGKIYGLIGTNGAGKTTVLNMISGLVTPTSGSIVFDGMDIVKKSPDKIAKCGISRTFQNLRLFPSMSVLDNVMPAVQINKTYNFFQAVLLSKKYTDENSALVSKAMELLKIVGLDHMADAKASSLPYGLQRKLEIARALGTNPKLLLLDEPAAGMNPQESHDLMNIILNIRDKFDATIILIEHDMKVVMGICEYIYAMAFGEVIDHGLPKDIVNSPRVIQAYLGGEAEGA